MKQNSSIVRLAISMFALFLSASLMAQTTKPTDKDLIGVWVMESLQLEGQKPMATYGDYSSIKVYRADGEYACAQVYDDGKEIYISAHEYGTYSFKNGKYIECGRNGSLVMKDKTHFEGQWQTRHEVWRKVTNMPAKLVDYVVDKCKRQNEPKDIQALAKQYILSKPKK